MKCEVSLILMINGDAKSTMFIDECVKNTGLINFELFIHSNKKDYAVPEQIVDHINTYTTSADFLNETSALNHLMSRTDAKYVCVIPEEVILSKNWLVDFVNKFSTIESIGIGTIPFNNEYEYLYLSHALQKDHELTEVLTSENNEHYGVVLFNRAVIHSLGAFDSDLNLKESIKQYSFRNMMAGMHNYYFPAFSCFNTSEKYTNEISLDYKESIKRLIATKNYFIQLYQMSIKDEMAYMYLDSITDESKKIFKFKLSYSGEYGLICREIDDSLFKSILEVSNRFDLKYNIKPHFDSRNHILTKSILVLFYPL